MTSLSFRVQKTLLKLTLVNLISFHSLTTCVPFSIFDWKLIWFDILAVTWGVGFPYFWSSAVSVTPVVPAECTLQCNSFASLWICLHVNLSLWERLKVQFHWEMHFSISKYTPLEAYNRLSNAQVKPAACPQGFNRPLHAYRLQILRGQGAAPGGNWF